jgi:hypothetical protein
VEVKTVRVLLLKGCYVAGKHYNAGVTLELDQFKADDMVMSGFGHIDAAEARRAGIRLTPPFEWREQAPEPASFVRVVAGSAAAVSDDGR